MTGSGLHVPMVAKMGVDPFAVIEKDGIRRFTDKHLDEAIQAAITRKKAGKDFVVVGHVDKDKIYFSALHKLGDDFSIVVAAYKSKWLASEEDPGKWNLGAEVAWTPF